MFRPAAVRETYSSHSRVNAHAVELRRYFVAHDGKKGLHVTDRNMDIAVLARKMSQQIHENVRAPAYRRLSK